MDILLINKSGLVRESIAQFLRRIPGVDHVDLAADLQELRSLLAGSHFSLIILDAEFQPGRAVDLLREIRDGRSPASVIMTGTNSLPLFRRECLRLGADFYCQLPEEIETLRKKVEHMIKRHTEGGDTP